MKQLREVLRTVAVKVEGARDSIFSVPINAQKSYLCDFPEPRDDIERSFFQYKCQMKLYGRWFTVLINLASLPLLLAEMMRLTGAADRCAKDSVANEKRTAVFLRDGKPLNIAPASLIDSFEDVESSPDEGAVLMPKDRRFLLQVLRRYPFSWHFILKVLIKVSRYSFIIEVYRPISLIVCNEYSFTSSAATAYLEQRGIDHINVMHGDKLFNIRDSFFRFSRCYIWDAAYKELFLKLRAEPEQFIVEVPPSLKFANANEVKKSIDFTYYLGRESKKQLQHIASIMHELKERGVNVSVRPHPRYSDTVVLTQMMASLEIEDCESVPIEQSILRTKNVIALYSTVLQQAVSNGVTAIIDDVTAPDRYGRLAELGFVMLGKRHRLLSDVLGRLRES